MQNLTIVYAIKPANSSLVGSRSSNVSKRKFPMSKSSNCDNPWPPPPPPSSSLTSDEVPPPSLEASAVEAENSDTSEGFGVAEMKGTGQVSQEGKVDEEVSAPVIFAAGRYY